MNGILRSVTIRFNKLLRNEQIRMLSAPPKKSPQDIPAYEKKDNDFKTSRKFVVKALEETLKVQSYEAYNMVNNNEALSKVHAHLIKNNYAKYKELNISPEVLIKYPQLLAQTEVDWKVSILKMLPYDLNDTIVLICLSVKQLDKLVNKERLHKEGDDKISILSNELNISKLEAAKILLDRSFMRSLSVQKLKSTMKILKDYGIPTSEIKSDIWIFSYSNDRILERFNIAKEHKIEIVKTWMVRATNEIFEHYMQRRSENKSILGNNSLAEYLSERLECNIEFANYLIVKQPVLKNKSLKKLKELIDFLFSKNFKPYHICRIPKILLHSVTTTQKRLKLLEDNNIQIDSLHMLTKSKKQFQQHFDVLKTKNQKK